MVVIVGCLVVIGCVLGGFMMSGGQIGALIHPSEIVTIGGASLGALIIMSPMKVLKDLFGGLLQLVKGSPYSKAAYMDLFKLFNLLTRTIRREGLISIDGHISKPEESPIFQQCPLISKNHHASHFLCNALALIVDGKSDAASLSAGLEEEIKVIDREHHAAVAALSKVADALPGFGIVAAVLGIVVTMGAIDGPVEEIGHKVGAALVGTFLGILLSYGFFAPMAGRMEHLGEEESTFFRCIATGVVAMSQGDGPRDVVTRASRGIGTEVRPTPGDLKTLFNEKEGG
ncbi:MAG: flagellar motor stator protein MotA [Gemmataceae bacterium]|nr:flagellar motor stator protein MotA [Gemmataceae bacterium]